MTAPHDTIPAQRRTPRVVVAHDYLTQCGGAERVVLAMLEAFPGARLVTSVYDPDATFPEFRDHQVETLWPDRFEMLRADPRRALPVLGRAISQHRIDDADVVLASSSGWAHGFTTDAPKVVYCHNPARWLYVQEDYLPGVPPYARVALHALSPMLRRWDRRAASTVTRYLANSSVVQRRIADAYGIEATVLHPPVAVDVAAERQPVPGLEPGFLLTISRQRGYKHADVACEAGAGLPGARLAVVGDLPERPGGWPEHVVGLGRVSDAQLRWLYANAAGLVGLSHEDFGLTPLEGYAFGVPSLLLRAGGYLDSSVEDVTTVFVDDVDVDQVRAAVTDLLARDWDRDAIRRHGDRFSLVSFQEALRRHVAEVTDLRPPVHTTPRLTPTATLPSRPTSPDRATRPATVAGGR